MANVIGTFKVYDTKENWSIIRHDAICYGKWVGLVAHMMIFVIYCHQCEEVTFFQFLLDPEPFGLNEIIVMWCHVMSCDAHRIKLIVDYYNT